MSSEDAAPANETLDAINAGSAESRAAEASGLPAASPDFGETAAGDEFDTIVPARGYQLTPIIGLGGSAGGIQALREFFKVMPADSGLVFVVVVHLSPEHESTLPELLQRFTAMPVVRAEDRVKVAANHVYVIPPGKHLSSADGHLRLTRLEPERGKRVAVDVFFRTLADSHGPHAAAIVLSGADGDGTIGLKRIKERGGLTIAQDPDEAEHDSMPRHAIETGMVDWVLKVREMPARLLDYVGREARLKLPPEDGPQPAGPAPRSQDDAETALRDVLVYLRTRTARDFSYYKRATILRRIARRMQVNGVDDMPAYLVFLRTHPGETGALLQDLLISVTNFFRDREAFTALQVRIPELFRDKGPADTVRVWCAACATGEEAYSVAMLLFEHARTLEAPPKINVFATDLDEAVVKSARAGVYPDAIATDVSEERLRQFFVKDPRGYRIRGEVRECVLFAQHDLLKDSPFSRLDLVTCRNLLIYLNRAAQKRVFDIFHFALRPEGRLFLGTSESVDDASELFTPLDKQHRLYARRHSARIGLPVPTGTGTLARSLQDQRLAAERVILPLPTGGGPGQEAGIWPHPEPGTGGAPSGELHLRALEHLGPPSMLVDRQHDIVHLSGTAGHYLQFGTGELTKSLMRAVHPMLRIELRAALYRATQTGEPAAALNVPIDLDGQRQVVNIQVSPAGEFAPGHLLIVFTPQTAPGGGTGAASSDDPVAQQLERELEALKIHLRDVLEQHESATEEQKAGNEELQAMNEELRSASEELETSREELQSINEELNTVNQEMKSKVDELGHANGDLHNLMNATDIATVFLDRDLRIIRYTPTATSIFKLIPSDVGRQLTDLTHRLDYPELEHDAARVLAQLTPIEREVGLRGEGWFLARLLPYRTTDDRIAGIVLSFVDVTERKRAEGALRASDERLQVVFESARDFAIFTLNDQGAVTSWNSGAETLFGYAAAEIVGHTGMTLCLPEDRAHHVAQREMETARREGRAASERWRCRQDGTRFWSSGSLVPLLHGAAPGHNDAPGFLVILSDRTAAWEAEQVREGDRSQLEGKLQENERARLEVEAASNAKDHFLAVLSHELRTPLTPILMALGSLMRRTDLPEPVRRAHAMIERNVQLEAHFIDDLLDMTRIARGKIELVREEMDLHEAAARAVEITAPDVDAKGQQLTVELDAAEYRVSGDFARLQQAMWNLLKNASKFTPEGGAISLRSRNEPGRIVIEVADTGIGLDAGAVERIFQPFEQADAAITREFGGLGLGLAIAKATIDAHQGELRAASAGQGQGATFTLSLPLARTDEAGGGT